MTDEPNPPEPPLDRETDAALRDAYAFAPAAAEEAASRFRVPAARRSRLPWLLLPIAAAAGIVAGLQFRRPVVLTAPGTPPRIPQVAAFVTVATRDWRIPGDGEFRAGRPVYAGGTVVVPADGRASLVLADGTEVRLDRGTRVAFPGSRTLEIGAGRVWVRVAPGEPFSLDAGPTRVTVTGTVLALARVQESTRVQLFSGSASVSGGGATRELRPGHEVESANGVLSEPRPIVSEALATGWMLELVARTGGHDRELADHLDRLLVDLGRTKAVMVDERTLVEDLGNCCRVPLARYLVSEGAQSEDEPRRKAARVLVRIADLSVAGDLARAIRDPDPEVRVSAARAIRRLSDGKVCEDPDAFTAAAVAEAAAPSVEAWANDSAPR